MKILIIIICILLTGCTVNKIEDSQLMSKRERRDVIEFMFIMHLCESIAIRSTTELMMLETDVSIKEESILMYALKNHCMSEYYSRKAEEVE